jgi:hypothetical protein
MIVTNLLQASRQEAHMACKARVAGQREAGAARCLWPASHRTAVQRSSWVQLGA